MSVSFISKPLVCGRPLDRVEVVAERAFAGLIVDYIGVLTSNLVEVIDLFEIREQLRPGTFLQVWADPRGQELYRRLELGEIDQRTWNIGFGALLGVAADNLMGRLLEMMEPAYEVRRVAWEARQAGVRTAVLSNSLGREPFDPYALFELERDFDVVVLSSDHGVRKPDPVIFQLTVDQLGVPAAACVFADDTEDNLLAAAKMGMAVMHAVDETVTVSRLRWLLRLPVA